MDIYFLRHASAGQYSPGSNDDQRPIDKTGEQQSHDVGRALAALDLKLDAILSSPLTRAITLTPPRPSACASNATKRRRLCSFRTGAISR